MSEENTDGKKLRARPAIQESASPKRKRSRPKKTENELPKRTRVGRNQKTRDCTTCLLETSYDCENSYPAGQVQIDKTDAKAALKISDIKRILRELGETFVKWIIEGVHSVQKENVLEASRKIQTIKLLLLERKVNAEKSKSVRLHKAVQSINSLLESANYLTTVIDNFLHDIVQRQQEGNAHDLSFTDMFQDDPEYTENTSLIQQDSMTMKSILKTSNIDSNTAQKKITFAAKATEVYQDNETSQISLAKSTQSAKSLEGNAVPSYTTALNSNIQTRPPLSRQASNQMQRTLENEATLADESPSIIESSFLNNSFSRAQGNYTKNVKKFNSKLKYRNKSEDLRSNDVESKERETFDIFQANSERNISNVEGELENDDNQNTYVIPSSNLFSDELVKTFPFTNTVSHNTGNSTEENVPNTSESASLPFHNFALTLPDGSSSEDSLNASVRMAVNIAIGRARNSEVNSPRINEASEKEEKTNWIRGPENPTKIIPRDEQFGRDGTGWKETPWDNVRGNSHATSDDSSLNISLLFEETEASWIPGTFDLQNEFNFCAEEAKMNTKHIPKLKEQSSSKQEPKCESNKLQVAIGSQRPPQEQDGRIPELQDNKKFDDYLDQDDGLLNAPKANRVYESCAIKDNTKYQGSKTFTVLDNSFYNYRNPQELGQMDVAPPKSELAKSVFPTEGYSVSRNEAKHSGFEPNNNENIEQSDEPERKTILLKEPSFKPPTQLSNAVHNRQLPPCHSFSELNKLYNQQEMKKTFRNDSSSEEVNNAVIGEPESRIVSVGRTQQCLKKNNVMNEPLFNPPTKNTFKQQPTPLFSESELEVSKTCENNEIGGIFSNKPKPVNCSKKNVLKTPSFQLPTANNSSTKDSERSSLTRTQKAQDGMQNIKTRFQETLLDGHWLRSGLQQNTTSSLFPSLKLLSNSGMNQQVNDNSNLRPNSSEEITLNQEIGRKLKVDTDNCETRNFEQRSSFQTMNLIQTPHASNNVQPKLMGNLMLNDKKIDLWKPRNPTLFSALLLSDTEPINKRNTDFQCEKSNIEWPDIQDSTKIQTIGWDFKNAGSLSKERTVVTSGVSSEHSNIMKQNKSIIPAEKVDNKDNHLKNALFTENPFNHQSQLSSKPNALRCSTLNDIMLVKGTTNANHQSSVPANEDNKIRHERNLTQSGYNEGQESFNYFSKLGEPRKTGALRQASYENDVINLNLLKPTLAIGSSHEQQSRPLHTSRTPSNYTELQFTANESHVSIESSNRLTDTTQDAKQDGDTKNEENCLNISGPKPRGKRGPKKKATTSKQITSKVQNEFIPDTQTSERSVSKGSQKQKKSQKKPGITKNKSPKGHSKTSAPMPNNSYVELNKEISSSAQDVGSKIVTSQPGVNENRTSMNDGQSILDGSSNPTNMERDALKSVFLRPCNARRKETAVADVAPASVGGRRYDLRLKRDAFNFFLMSRNENNNLDNYQSRGAEKGKVSTEEVKKHVAQNEEEQNFEEMEYPTQATRGSEDFLECDELSWGESPTCNKSHTSFSSRSNTPEEKMFDENTIKSKTCDENPMEYLSLTQLSWGQSATCGIPHTPTQSCAPESEICEYRHTFKPAAAANNRGNTPHEETHLENTTLPRANSENIIEYQSLTQLSWGQSATCGIPIESTQNSILINEICKNQETRKSPKSLKEKGSVDYGQNKNETAQPGNQYSVFKQPFSPRLKQETNQLLSFTEFMEHICVSSTDNVFEKTPPKKFKTEEEEIEDILNGIEFVRVPPESELIEASSIDELINDQTFIW